MPRPQPPKGYITAGEAVRRLKVDDSMLTRYVRQGRLKRYGPEERKHKYYKESEVQAIIDANRAFFGAEQEASSETDAVFALATPADIPGIYDLALRTFHRTTSAEHRLEWLQREPRGNYIVRHKSDGAIVAYLTMLPIKQELLVPYMRGELGREIAGNDIEPFEPGRPATCIIKGIASEQNIDDALRTSYVAVLLRGIRSNLEHLGREGITIPTLYAFSSTDTGISMCMRLGMQEWEPSPDGKRFTFWIDIASSDAFVFQLYKRGFAEWQREHPEVQNLVPITTTLEEGLQFRRATPKDMEMENYLAYLNYWPGGTAPAIRAARQALPKYNPESCYHLYDRGNLVASINFLPVSEQAIEEFKQGKRGWLFVPDQVEQFIPGRPLHCIIIDFLSLPIAPPKRRSAYAMQLLLNLAVLLKEWGSQGIDIATIHACGSTDLGRSILRNAHFRELGEPVSGRVMFELDIQSSDLKPLQPYKQALAAWKAKHTTQDTGQHSS